MKSHSIGRVAALGLALACWAGVACEPSSPESDVVVLKDSLGIRILESRPPGMWGSAPQWRISERPVASIGVAGGEPAYMLHIVTGAVRLKDGRIVIANAGSGELRWFDSEGQHLRTVGGVGDGPAEFQNIRGVWPFVGDSLLVYDAALRRVSVFDDEGALGRTFRLDDPVDGVSLNVLDVGDQGTILAVGDEPVTPAVGPGLHRLNRTVSWHGPDGGMQTALPSVPGTEWIGIDGSYGLTLMSRPFGRSSHVTTDGSRVFVGDSDRYEIRVYGNDGSLETIVRKMTEDRPVRAEDVEEYIDTRIQRASSEEAARVQRELMDGVEFPDTYPSFIGLRADELGNLWVEAPRAPDGQERTYSIFDGEGRLLGTMGMPEDLRLLYLGGEYLLALYVDGQGLQSVRLYALERS